LVAAVSGTDRVAESIELVVNARLVGLPGRGRPYRASAGERALPPEALESHLRCAADNLPLGRCAPEVFARLKRRGNLQ
jgi:hypothetical protein